MSTPAICKRMKELREELCKRGFYKTCGVQSKSLKDPKPALNTHDDSCLPNVHVPLHATNIPKKSHITQTIRAYSHRICWSLIGANAYKSIIIFYANEGLC